MDDKHEVDEDEQGWLNSEAETGEPDGAGDAEEDNTRLLKSAVHDEYLQTLETVEVKSKNGKEIKVTKWKSSCKHCPKIFNHKKQWDLKKHLIRMHPDVNKVVEEIDDSNREEQRRDKQVWLDTSATSGTEVETGDGGGVAGFSSGLFDTKLSKSAVHEEYLQTSEIVEVKSRNGKKNEVTK